MVTNKIGLLMLSTDQTHKERLADKLSTKEQRPHDKPVSAAKDTCSTSGSGQI